MAGLDHLGLCALVLIGSAAHAAHPLGTEDTATQGAGNIELENGCARARGDGASQTGCQLQMSWGAATTLDVLVQPSWSWQRSADGPAARGFGDTNLDFKWRFYGQAPLSLALRAGATLATSQQGLGLPHGTLGTHATLVATVDADPFACHANVGLTRNPRLTGLRQHVAHAAAAMQWAASDRWTLSAETTADAADDPQRHRWTANMLLGLVYTVRPGLDLDAGVQVTINAPTPTRTALIGVTWRFAP